MMQKLKDYMNFSYSSTKYDQHTDQWENATPIKRILYVTLGGSVIGTLVGAYRSFVYEVPVVPFNASMPYSIYKNLSYLGKNIVAISGITFSYQFTKELISSFKGRDSVYSYLGAGFAAGFTSGVAMGNIKRGFVLGGIFASLITLTVHMPDTHKVRLREVLADRKEATEIMSTLSSIEHHNEREKRRLEELEQYEKL